MSKLTNATKGKVCIKCGGHDAFAAHYNGPRQHDFGKGRGVKCDDLMTADFCYKCDQEFSEGSMLPRWNGNKWERSEEFMYWIAMTNIRRLKGGVLKV